MCAKCAFAFVYESSKYKRYTSFRALYRMVVLRRCCTCVLGVLWLGNGYLLSTLRAYSIMSMHANQPSAPNHCRLHTERFVFCCVRWSFAQSVYWSVVCANYHQIFGQTALIKKLIRNGIPLRIHVSTPLPFRPVRHFPKRRRPRRRTLTITSWHALH